MSHLADEGPTCARCPNPIPVVHGSFGGREPEWLHVLIDADGIHYRRHVNGHAAKPPEENN